MKKSTNIAALKELVNYNVLDRVKLRVNGVQAYNIAEGEEYTVIVKYEKQRGRYYFVDRDGRRFLASHYDRAEFIAGEMLAVIAEERSAAQRAAEQVKASGSVAVCSSLCDLFFEECDILGIRVKSTAVGVDNLGRMLTCYDLVKDDEPAQQEDSDNNDAQSNESDQTTAEPSRLAKAAAKVKAYARRAAFDVSLLAVVVLCFVVFFACIPAFNMMLKAAGIEGTACTVFTWCALFPALDITSWLECNALAVLARLFPDMFRGPRPEFLRPCSILAKAVRNSL
jgi:hypothetical protein|nr:MAG TPA: hypothetical protein [Caudoviricetes sp.]